MHRLLAFKHLTQRLVEKMLEYCSDPHCQKEIVGHTRLQTTSDKVALKLGFNEIS
jgi:hypothetical protein